MSGLEPGREGASIFERERQDDGGGREKRRRKQVRQRVGEATVRPPRRGWDVRCQQGWPLPDSRPSGAIDWRTHHRGGQLGRRTEAELSFRLTPITLRFALD